MIDVDLDDSKLIDVHMLYKINVCFVITLDVVFTNQR